MIAEASSSLTGFSSIPTETGSFHRITAVTDFETTQAKMGFPYFDEPLCKVNFSIGII